MQDKIQTFDFTNCRAKCGISTRRQLMRYFTMVSSTSANLVTQVNPIMGMTFGFLKKFFTRFNIINLKLTIDVFQITGEVLRSDMVGEEATNAKVNRNLFSPRCCFWVKHFLHKRQNQNFLSPVKCLLILLCWKVLGK